MMSFMLKAHDHVEHVSLKDFWNPEPLWRYVGASFLVGLVVLGGVILLIVPGIIFGLMYGFACYLVITSNLQPMEALRESHRITNRHKWTLFQLGLLSLLVVVLGVVCVLVGVLAAIPVVALAQVHAFRELQKMAGPTPTEA